MTIRQFAVFDHMDRGEVSLAEQYANRLKLVEAYDQGGFYAYHLAEHHSTPLGIAPSPSVYLSAVAQRTSRLRFGSLVYTLSMHHPVRVMEEICMLDQMSGGRLEVGFGRGISPYEIGYYGVDPAQAQSIYLEAYQVIMQGLTQTEIDFSGKHFTLKNVPVEMQCVQQPTPPIWCGVGQPEGTKWTADNRINIVCNGTPEHIRATTDQYRAHWLAAGHTEDSLPFMGVSRHVVVADSDRQAEAIAERAYKLWYERLMHLWVKHGVMPKSLAYPDNFADARRVGLGVAGSPQTVRRWIEAEAQRTGINYFVCRMAFGDMRLDESLQSTRLFCEEVMPALIGARAERK